MSPRIRMVLAAVAWAAAGRAGAQDLAHRVAQVKDGTVRFSFAAREGVCGNGRNGINVRGEGDARLKDVEWECERGPVMVALSKKDGEIVSLRAYVGARWKAAGGDVVNVGTVGVREATDWLLDVAASAPGKASSQAIFPATLADSVQVWPRLLRIARDESRPRESRNQSVFWLGQAASDEATKGLAEVVDDANGDREVRKQAVFALSQQRSNGVESLLNIARTNKDKEIRKQAIFWLGQSKDPRALEYFESVLKK
ncbi:MAG: HEAT repeat domain-containing protein [Gemmatimonadaceae bacterium]